MMKALSEFFLACSLCSLLIVAISLASSDIKTCGFPSANSNSSCRTAVSCNHCIGFGGGEGNCVLRDQTPFDPLGYETDVTPSGESTQCWTYKGVVDCYTICDCDNADNECDSTSPCSIFHHDCSTTTVGPRWVRTGVCGEGSPCDEI